MDQMSYALDELIEQTISYRAADPEYKTPHLLNQARDAYDKAFRAAVLEVVKEALSA